MESEEEDVPRWAEPLLAAQKESDQRLKVVEQEMKSASKQMGRKSEPSPETEFKFKRNKKQHKLNKKVLSKIEAALETTDEDARHESLQQGKDLLIVSSNIQI